MSDLTIPGDEFWRVLLDNGALDQGLVDEFKQALEKSPRKPLGQILVREGFMSVSQVAGLISIQADEPHMRLGDLAVREGVCTAEQIEAALSLQTRTSPGPVALLMGDDRVQNDALLEAVASYMHHLEGRVRILRDAVAATVSAEA